MVKKIKNLQNLELLREKRLGPIPTNYNFHFSLTTIKDRFILLTGGVSYDVESTKYVSKQVLLYDSMTRKIKNLPDLNKERAGHTSCSWGSKAFVFDLMRYPSQ